MLPDGLSSSTIAARLTEHSRFTGGLLGATHFDLTDMPALAVDPNLAPVLPNSGLGTIGPTATTDTSTLVIRFLNTALARVPRPPTASELAINVPTPSSICSKSAATTRRDLMQRPVDSPNSVDTRIKTRDPGGTDDPPCSQLGCGGGEFDDESRPVRVGLVDRDGASVGLGDGS